jgi:hypothetical protein
MKNSADSARELRSQRLRSVRCARGTQPQVETIENKSLLSANLAGAVVSVGGSPVAYEFLLTSGNVYYSTSSGGGPTELGSNLNAQGISAVAVGNVPYVFEFDSSNNVYANSYNGSSWTGWIHVSSQTTDGASAISAVNVGGTPGVFEINQSYKVYYDSYNGSTWSGWTHVSSQTSDGSIAISGTTSESGTPAVFEINQSNNLYYDYYTGTAWSGWTRIGPTGVGATAISATNFRDTPAVFFINGSGQVWYYYQENSTTWSSALELGGDVGALQIDVTTYYDGTTQQPVVELLNSSGDVYYDYFITADNAWSGWIVQDNSSGDPITNANEIAIAPEPGTSNTGWVVFNQP